MYYVCVCWFVVDLSLGVCCIFLVGVLFLLFVFVLCVHCLLFVGVFCWLCMVCVCSKLRVEC